MTEYSGRTTAYAHKFPGWETRDGTAEDCIKQMTVFDVQWSSCPIEVQEEVHQLWRDYECMNDKCIVKWETEEMCEEYPVIAEYLRSRGVDKCWIHWWW